MTDSMSAAEYRKMMGLTPPGDVQAEMDAEIYARMQQTREFAGVPRTLFEVERTAADDGPKKPKGQVKFEEWLEAVSPFPVVREYRFIPGRQFKGDYCIPEIKLCIEYDGLNPPKAKPGETQKDRAAHMSIQNVLSDSRKGNLAQVHGWMFIRVNAISLRENDAYEHVIAAFAARGHTV